MEFLFVPVSLIFVAVQVLVSFALVAWGRRTAVRQGGGVFWRVAAWAPMAALCTGAIGLGITIVGLIGTFKSLGNVPASEKQQLLSDGIATAMGATAVAAPLATLLYLGGIVIFAVGSSMPQRANAATKAAEAAEAAAEASRR